MSLDKNSFNVFDKTDLNDVYDLAHKFYMSEEQGTLSSTQQVARSYVEAVLSVAFARNIVVFPKKENKDEIK